MADDTKQCTTCGRRFGDEAIFCPKDGTALVPITSAGRGGKDSYLGREILGHIEIRSLIGAGAMGRVYRAYQKGIDRDVAVKILHKELASNPDLVARFLREAKVASRLAHPNVVQVLLAGQLEDGTMYLVMEHLDGVSLQSALLAAGGALPVTRALHVALQVCDAVGEAHAHGVIHRDVKPENIMLVRRGDDMDFVKVLDFGIARLGGQKSDVSVETQAGLVFGTARYLSPEGARGEHVGPSSDVYAIATVVFQMLAGRTPFENDSSVSLLVAQIHDVPPTLRSIPRARSVPVAIEAAVMKNLAKNAAERDVDGHAFGRALLDAAIESGYVADDLIVRPAVARARKVGPSMNPPTEHKTRVEGFGSGHGIDEGRPSPAELPATPEPRGVYNPSYSGKPAVAEREKKKSNVAQTMDNEPPPPPSGPSRLKTPVPMAPPLGVSPATVGMSPQPLTPNPSPTVATPPQGTTPHAPHVPQTPQPPAPEPRASTPAPAPAGSAAPSGTSAKDDSMLGTSTSAESLRPAGVPRRGRFIAAIAVAGLVAVAGLGIGGYRLGYFGGKTPTQSKNQEVEDLLTRAQTALEARHWDAPPGDNVVELTDHLIQIAPGETRTYQIRSIAADRILREAIDANDAKDLTNALRLFKLAARLSPPDLAIQHYIESIEADLANDPEHFAEVTDGGVAGKYVVTKLEIGDAKDPDGTNPNEVVPLLAWVKDGPGAGANDPKSSDPKAHFLVSGPGLAKPISLDAKAESTTRYAATYAFKELGTYEVSFFARPDGFPVKSETDVPVVPAKKTVPTVTTKPSNTSLKPNPPPTGTIILTPDPTIPLPFPTTTAPPVPTLGSP